MLRLIFIKAAVLLAIILAIAAHSQAQNVKKDKDGNYIAIGRDSTATGKTYTDKSGAVLPVYTNEKGKLFVCRTSKNGRGYRYYLKVD